MSDDKHQNNPDNQLSKRLQGKEKKEKNQAHPINLEQHVIAPNKTSPLDNIIVPFENCIRVQNNYFIEFNNEIVPVNKDVIRTDYGNSAANRIRKYLKFVNEPSHLNYRKDFGVFYNLYRNLSHEVKKGNIEHIETIIKHLFRGMHYEMVKTYLWVMYMQPKQQLPLIGLVSPHKGTGKTTFLLLLKATFELNAKFLDPSDISANFNSSFLDKNCILIDEKIEGKDRQQNLQKLKKLITGGVHNKKEKHISDVDVNFYGKFIMCSNDNQMMLAIEKDNTRFWIVDVKKFEGQEDLDILVKAIPEIPAFLHHLRYEYQPMKRKGRLWFSVEDIQTERSKVLQENSRNTLAKEVVERLADYFVEHVHLKQVIFASHHFITHFGLHNISVVYFSRVMRGEFEKKTKEHTIGNPFNGDPNRKRCRCFIFHREEIIKNSGEPPPEDKSKFYDPEWIDGEFN